MRVAVLVIGKLATRRCLAHLLGANLAARLGEGCRELERRERRAGVPARSDHDGVEGLVGDRVFAGETALVFDRALDEHLDAVIAYGLELDEYASAR